VFLVISFHRRGGGRRGGGRKERGRGEKTTELQLLTQSAGPYTRPNLRRRRGERGGKGKGGGREEIAGEATAYSSNLLVSIAGKGEGKKKKKEKGTSSWTFPTRPFAMRIEIGDSTEKKK